MAKIVIPRLFEISRYLNTEAGKELKDCLSYLSYFIDVTVRALKEGLTFQDNFQCVQKTAILLPGVLTPIAINNPNQVVQIMVQSVQDPQYYTYSSFGWTYATDGSLNVIMNFTGSPPATQQIQVSFLIFFG